MKKQIIASSTKRSYVKAASTEKMLNAFEGKLEELQGEGIESSTEVTSSVHLTDEQRDILWDVIDQYNTSHPVSGRWEDETAHEQRTIADTFGISLADAKQIMIDELGFDPNLEGHMEGDHWAEEDLNSATEVTCTSFTPEQEDLLWKIDDRYEGDVADEDVPSIIAQIQRDIMSELGVDAKTAKRAMVDVLLYDPNDIEASTDITANDQLQLFDDDGYHNYEDTDGLYTGIPGSFVTLAELKNYWNDFYNDDPVLNEEYQPDEGQRWLADTLAHMKEVDASTNANTEELDEELEPVKGEQEWGDDQVFMLMDYISGTEGMESDTFDCIGKFFAADESDAKRQLARAKRNNNRIKFLDNPYISQFNEYFDNGDEVYVNLDALLNDAWIDPNDYGGNMPEEPVFESTDVEASLIVNDEEVADTTEDIECEPVNDPINAALIIDDEEVADTIEDIECQTIMDGEEVAQPFDEMRADNAKDDAATLDTIECGLFDDYFGKEQADKYGDLITSQLSGQTVSKRRDLAEQPGGLIYEANLLGIDMWDLLEALEGLCYQGRAMEIDDSTYKVK